MDLPRFFYFVVLCHLHFLVFSQNHISITVSNGDAVIKYFPPAKTFANVLYHYQLPSSSNGQYTVNLESVSNKELCFLIDNQDVNVYVGQKDTIRIFYDAAKKNYSFSGDNAMLNQLYNLEIANRGYYKSKLEEFFFNLKSDEGEGAARFLTNEMARLNQLFLPAKGSTDCAQAYLTSRIIGMMFWLQQTYPSKENFKDILPELLKCAKLEDGTIRNCSNNFGFYQIYYSTRYPNDLQDASPWLSSLGYIFHAPADIRDFMIQTTYIGNYNFARDYYNWCAIYSEIKEHVSEIYYEGFFQEHRPCK